MLPTPRSKEGTRTMLIGFRQKAIVAVYLLLLTLLSSRAYLYSLYDMDMMGYIGNAVAISGASVRQIHDASYRALETEVPPSARDHLLGRDKSGPASQWESRQDRAVNPGHFAEYLPCFAIRPIFNELVYLLHFKLGIGLVRATIVISVFSYWLIGFLVFSWLCRYATLWRAALGSLLLVLSPPLLDLARFNTPDALACLVSLAALYFIFELDRLFWGLTLLLLSVYVRTDNVLLAIAVLAYCSVISKQLEKTKAAALMIVAVLSVLLINHFAGDYGLRMLYYRSFVAIPLAPGELVVSFGMVDYLRAFRTAVSQTMVGSMPLFLLMGVVGLCAQRHRITQALAAVTAFYLVSHFLLFPSGQERFWGILYVGCGLILMVGAWYRNLGSNAPSCNSSV